MKFKGTWTLAAALAAIALYYFLVDVPGGEKAQEEKERAEKLLVFEPDKVEEITLSRSGETIVLKSREGKNWEVTQPVQAHADKLETQNLLAAIAEARFSRVVEESPANPSAFGLQNPPLTITLKTQPDGKTQSLSFGDPAPVGHSHYVRRGGEQRILLSAADTTQFEKNLLQLRDKTILDFTTGSVSEAEILRRGRPPVKLVKKSDVWWLSAPFSAKADSGAVKNLLDGVQFAGVQQFVDENPADLSAYGLDVPHARLAVTVGDKKEIHSLDIGNLDPQGNRFARSSRGKNVFLIGSQMIHTVLREDLDFLDKTLLEFKEEEVAEIRIRKKQTIPVIVEHDGKNPGQWKITSPAVAPANPSAVITLIKDLKNAAVPAFVSGPATDLTPYGLAAPEQSLTLVLDGKKTAGFDLGSETRDGKSRYGKRQGESTVFVITDETAQRFMRGFDELQLKKLLNFEAAHAAKIEIVSGGQSFELVKSGKDWSLARPERIARLQDFVARDILWTLDNLDFAFKEGGSKPDAGFDKPAMTVSVYDAGGKPLVSLRVGARVAGQNLFYAQTGNDPALYQIRDRFLDEIPKELEKFKSQSPNSR